MSIAEQDQSGSSESAAQRVGTALTTQSLVDIHAIVLGHDALADAAQALARDLARRLDFDLVSVGLRREAAVEVVASSHLAEGGAGSGAPSAQLAQLAAALAECIDQEAVILQPDDSAGAPIKVCLAHQRLLDAQGGAILTVPLAAGGKVFAALAAQRTGARRITADEATTVAAWGDAAAAALRLMWLNERSLWARWRDQWRTREARRSQAQRRRRQLLAGAGGVALFVAAAVPMSYQVGGAARLEGAVQRVIVAPADGFLKAVHVRPGDLVKTGQALVELAEQDMQLERQRWQSQLAQFENAYAAASVRSDRAQWAINQSKAAEAEAQIALVDLKLSRARIDAPFDGVVIQGDLSQQLGAPVQQGSELLTLAPSNRFRVMIEIDERDIAGVREGAKGSIALSALPWDTLPLRVTRMAALSTPVEGRNVFAVEAVLLKQPDNLRPGLQGSAKLEAAGSLPPLWVWTSRVTDWLRLRAWAWFG